MSEATADRYLHPDLSCDVVMKGGITSGVVYPGAVLALAKRYRLRCVGGASAGGIAAAIVAAAEYARYNGGFEKLEKLPGELTERPEGRAFMLQLFQADHSTRQLFSVLVGWLQHKVLGAFWGALRGFPRFPLAALTVMTASIMVSVFAHLDAVVAVSGVFAAMVILVAGMTYDLIRAVGGLAENDFGLCRLGPKVGTEQAPALTGWLHQRIQSTANREGQAPLTFADLWAGQGVILPLPKDREERLAHLVALSREPTKRAVDLQIVTTDLTHGRPMRLPVPYQQWENILEEGNDLLFDPIEMGLFFPEDVVKYLEQVAPPKDEATQADLRQAGREHLLRFPIGPDLPVVVATRMTLSFPLLISAIPLHKLDRRTDKPQLIRVYFSDGGISSNFPVHFFDSPLPTRPTFGLNLISFPPGEHPDPSDPCKAISGPPRPNRPAPEPLAYISGLPSFLTAIKDAMQNWRDNAQVQLPGFRDRVVDIKLDKGEGGINLTMPSSTIDHLNRRGKCAGNRLTELFAGDSSEPTEQWKEHRFVRYRTIMALLERLLRGYDQGYEPPAGQEHKAHADPGPGSYAGQIAEGTTGEYPFTEEGPLAFAQEVTSRYLGLVDEWDDEGHTLDDPGVPRPPSTLRAIPPV